ncbi:MAG TPA: hypothetical protein VD993_17810 [Chitinophagaceae bacterium]|nr:hypothetical protein [Chitinophagaceae bacterium]
MKKSKSIRKEKLPNLAQSVLKTVDLAQVKGAEYLKYRYAYIGCVDGFGTCDPRPF